MLELRYTLALVTGGGGGLGRELAVALSRRGAAVLVADRDLDAAQETVALVERARVRGWAHQGDLADEHDVRLLAARARDLGGADVLVNNAGSWSPGEQYPAADPAVWSRTLDLDLRSPMLLTQLFLDGLDERRGRRQPGAVVNVASSAALGAAPYASPEYAAAKAGLIRFTTALGGLEAARVMAVVPGWIGLPRALERVGDPEPGRAARAGSARRPRGGLPCRRRPAVHRRRRRRRGAAGLTPRLKTS